MLYRPPSFRKTAFAVTAAAAIAGASIFASNSASATEPNKSSDIPAACAAMTDMNERAGCLFAAIKKHTVQMKNEQKAAEKDLKATAESDVCFAFLTKGRDEKKFTREAVVEAAGGRLTVENTCAVARKFGFGQRASADAPRMQ